MFIQKTLTYLLLLLPLFVQAQPAPEVTFEKKRFHLPFQQVNNLILVDLTINAQPYRFLLDTGVHHTLIFNPKFLDPAQNIKAQETAYLSISGLGKNEPIKAFRTVGNTIQIGKMKMEHQTILWLDEMDAALGSKMGVSIDGIIGMQFFKHLRAKIDYRHEYIQIRSLSDKPFRTKGKYYSVPITFFRGKPFVTAKVHLNDTIAQGSFLLDSGSSDAIWLFENKIGYTAPTPYFKDYLGYGINGDVFGKRGKMTALDLGFHTFKEPKIAYPDAGAFQNITMKPDRIGSIGGEILSRFKIIIAYAEQKVYLQLLSHVDAPFYYNMSGIDLQYYGVKIIATNVPKASSKAMPQKSYNPNTSSSAELFLDGRKTLKTVNAIAIDKVRPHSPASRAGIQEGDELLRINGRNVVYMNLAEINRLLQRRPGQRIRLLVSRNGQRLEKEFYLEELFK